jgi:hypothetical protein
MHAGIECARHSHVGQITNWKHEERIVEVSAQLSNALLNDLSELIVEEKEEMKIDTEY